MSAGDVYAVGGPGDVHYVDTGMFDTPTYGSVYLLDAERPALVDTGTGANREPVLAAMDEVGIDPAELELLLLTHVHLDHAGGAGHLLEACPNAAVRCHEFGVEHLTDPDRLVAGTKAAVRDQWQYYAEPVPVPADRISGVEGGQTVDLGDGRLDVLEAPGHAPHQVMFHDTDAGLLFTGDAAGIYVPARDEVAVTSPPVNFDLEQCLSDVRTIQSLAPERLCFGHFGDRAYERDLLDGYKRTLVEWVEAVRRVRERADDDGAAVEQFVEHAEYRDLWGDERAGAEASLNARGVFGYLDRRDGAG